MRKKFLREALAGESRAYGFTIAFWGSGALLVKYHGLPMLSEALMYGIGAITGFGLLTLYAYKGKPEKSEKYNSDVMIFGMVHYIAALLPIATTFYTSRIEAPYNFLITGFLVSMLYNIGMIVEASLPEKGKAFEQKFLG